MDRIEQAFATLSQRMNRLAVPDRAVSTPESLTSLIAKVDAAKRLYEPGMMRR